MFKKLHRQLVISNSILLSLVLVIIFTGFYFVISNLFIYRNYEEMNYLANQGSIKQNNIMGFILVNEKFGIQEIYAPYQNEIEEIKNWVKELKSYDIFDESHGYFEYNGNKIRYVINKKGLDTTYVFLECSNERIFLFQIQKSLIIVAVISICLLIFISHIIAKKALIPIKNAFYRQQEFVQDASHELRTPLAIIKTNAEIVEQCVDDEGKEWLENINFEVDRMVRLVSDLSYVARSNINDKEQSIEIVNISKDALRCARSFEPRMQQKKLRFKYDIEENLLLKGNEHKIKQLIEIFLDNAYKYTPEEGMVNLSLFRSTKNNVILKISDSGIGISKADQKYIFKRFYRVDKSRNRKTGGSGLGLSIADCIIKEHNAQVTIDSEENKGTTFTIEFRRSNNEKEG